MRALSRSEQSHVAGGRKFNPIHAAVGAGATPDLKQPLPGPGGTDPGVHVVGYVFDAPPSGFDSWWEWDAMNTFYWEAVPSPVGGGVGGTTNDQPIAYNDGFHKIYATTATSENGLNNPGDIMWGTFAENWSGATESSTATSDGTLAHFTSEQSGLDALASLLDHNYGNDTVANFAYDHYTTDPSAEEQNVEAYMSSHGYSVDNGTSINDLSDAEFNTFLNAISYAEGNTDLNG